MHYGPFFLAFLASHSTSLRAGLGESKFWLRPKAALQFNGSFHYRRPRAQVLVRKGLTIASAGFRSVGRRMAIFFGILLDIERESAYT